MFKEIPAAIAYEKWLEHKGEEKRLAYDLDENSVVYDIGGHVGDWASDIWQRYKCHIHIFEPMPEFAEKATKRFADNPKVVVHNCALMDYEGTANLAVFGTGSSLCIQSSNTVSVKVRSIGQLMNELGHTHIQLAKINIEGAEFDLLSHMIETGLVMAFDNLQIQFHDNVINAIDKRRRIQEDLSVSYDLTYNYSFIWENWCRKKALIKGYEPIARSTATQMTAFNWNNHSVADIQHQAFKALINAHHAGAGRKDFEVLEAALDATGLSRGSLLEVGCGSAYLSEVIVTKQRELTYLGIDYAEIMISKAKEYYPQHNFLLSTASSLPLASEGHDIVLNGVSLMHIMDYPKAIEEAARVAAKYCIFHTVPVHKKGPSLYFRKFAYGLPVVEIHFNEQELLNLFKLSGLKVIQQWQSLDYDMVSQVGEDVTTQTYLCEVIRTPLIVDDLKVNLGCGSHYDRSWENYDITPHSSAVKQYDISQPLPIEDESCGLVYHSHVLEHLPRWQALPFLKECARLLRPGGVLRVAVPDLEGVCRQYLENLSMALAGDRDSRDKVQWSYIELLDQMTRDQSGGEMYRYWHQSPMPVRDYVLQRIGYEAKPMMDTIAQQSITVGETIGGNPLFANRVPPSLQEVATFRRGGEIHQWMYDRLSLADILCQAGFICPTVKYAGQSSHPDFATAHLELFKDGSERKPDSLYMEAFKPSI